jgi:hypothetical protein
MRETQDHVAAVVDILMERHPLVDRPTLEGWVAQAFDGYRSAPVQAYVPILAQREIEARLRGLEGSGFALSRSAGEGNSPQVS